MGSISDAVTFRKRKFDVDEYHRLGEAGILNHDDRVELIEGEVIEPAPITGEHATVVSILNMILARQCNSSQLMHVQNPLRLDRYSEPQPDLVLARLIPGFRDVPNFKDALLVIEVSDSTYNYDRKIKAPLYARAGVPELWIVDCQNRRVEIHADAKGDEYSNIIIADDSATLAPRLAENIKVRFADLWE
jgi:Uma2 family endonuclease